jgi:site-specific DNA-adenine methylase
MQAGRHERSGCATAAPFAWYGGKQPLAGRIVDLLPPPRTYVEAAA